ncbi:MAG: VPEID-CTERM sorting domain-containing protein [Rhodobacterales bacterium]
MTGLKIVTTAMASASALVMSTVMAAAMGGRSGRPESSYNLPTGGSSGVGSGVGSGGATPVSGPNVASVPEIDASTGLLAMAAVLAVIAFVWERNRRQRA